MTDKTVKDFYLHINKEKLRDMAMERFEPSSPYERPFKQLQGQYLLTSARKTYTDTK